MGHMTLPNPPEWLKEWSTVVVKVATAIWLLIQSLQKALEMLG